MQCVATELELIEADGIGAGEDGSSKMHGLWSDAKFSAYAVRTASGQSQFFFFFFCVCLCVWVFRISAGHENCSCCALPLEASSRSFRHSQAGIGSFIVFCGILRG